MFQSLYMFSDMKNIGRAIIALCTSSVLSFAGAAEWQDKNTGIWWSYSIQDDGMSSPDFRLSLSRGEGGGLLKRASAADFV